MFRCIRWKWAVVLVLYAASLFACGEPSGEKFEDSPDGPEESAFADGKADDLFGDCHLEHMVLFANEADSDADALVDHGVHTRAARNIEEYRAGSDGELGTKEDRYFQTPEQIDDVYFVGPTAMHQLAGAVDDYCTDLAWREVDTVFSPNPHHESHIAEAVDMIDGADESIDLAMYSLSDHSAFQALEDAVERGVDVRVLYDGANGDHLDLAGSRSARLEDLGADVRYINRVMHHKFAIIDGPQNRLLEASDARLFTGSGNLSYGAASIYDENTAFHRGDPTLVLTLQKEFNHLWENSRNIEWNDELEYFETMPVDEQMIPEADDLEVLLTSQNFETTFSNRWGPGFRPLDFETNVADRLVELIEDANSSIYLAASFLRSRPVTEAIIERWNEDPDLDVRIYLDQSEYVSPWFHSYQESELEECLDDAGDDPEEIFDCEQTGFIFSYELVSEDIPVRFKTYAFRWHYTYAQQMHHKYLIVDENTVATGSYNYSNNAERNTMENVVVYRSTRYPSVVGDFVDNFETIWETGRTESVFDELMDHIAEADEIDLVFDDPVALTHDQVSQLRSAIRDRCPQVDDDPFRSHPEDHHTCEVE